MKEWIIIISGDSSVSNNVRPISLILLMKRSQMPKPLISTGLKNINACFSRALNPPGYSFFVYKAQASDTFFQSTA